jgi:hypothetical protein
MCSHTILRPFSHIPKVCGNVPIGSHKSLRLGIPWECVGGGFGNEQSTDSIYLNVHNNCWRIFCIVATTGGLYMSIHASIPDNVIGNTWECQGVRCCSSTYALVHAQEVKA